MRIKISSNKIGYDLTLYGKYSFLCGDSGNGKTTLHKLLTQYLFTPRAVKYSSDTQVYPVSAQADEDVLQKHEGELLVIDERALLLKNPDISKLLRESPNYF